MKCKNCGMELEKEDKVCSSCGLSISDIEEIKITFDDEQEEIVDPPVIIEAHTFIDEESFAKKVNEAKAEQEEEKETFNKIYKVFFVLFVVIIIGFVVTFVVLPNISNNKENNILEEETFTTEDWKSG